MTAGPPMPVNMCVCHHLPFAELKQIAAAGSLNFDQLSAQTKCSTGCGMCRVYVKLMLATGETRFPVLNPVSIRQYLKARGLAEDAVTFED